MQTTRRRFLQASAIGALAACGASGPRPNILWIIAEDFSPELGCYGNPDVATPNIDRLASEGVRFTHCISTSPVCSTARSALMTGMYQTSINAHHHRSHRGGGNPLPDGVRPFTALFRDAGYHTSNMRTSGGTGKTDFNFDPGEPPFDGEDWSERGEGQPFYAQINFQETHRAFKPFPDRPIDPASVAMPPYYPDHPAARLDWALYLETAQHLDRKVGALLGRLEEEGLAEDTIVVFMSDGGRAMPRGKQFLYDGGVLIPLIVRFPEKFRPQGVEPGRTSGRLVSHIDITATSLALAGIRRPPKMQGRVFIGPDADREREYAFSARDRCDETVDRIRSVRTKRYKYLRNFMPERPYTQPNHYKETSYPMLQILRQLHEEDELSVEQALFMSERRPEEELYDLEADPHEVRNLAGSADHAAVLEEVRAALEKWAEETNDMGRTREGPLPPEYDFRTHAAGFATVTGKLSIEDGALMMRWEGDRNEVRRPWVAEGGQFALRFRARATGVTPRRLFWGTIDNVRGQGNEALVDLPVDSRWRELTVPFETSGWLANFGLDFGPGEGTVEFSSISLHRRRAGRLEPLQEWRFEG